jgi:hypothetical protein
MQRYDPLSACDRVFQLQIGIIYYVHFYRIKYLIHVTNK